jgi:dihydroneopterin aldolase|tara:strand:+ start:523 stop:876 length:354 start_codon:yes stop_codon:yes gene_type:complete
VTDTIVIEQLQVDTVIGVYEHERSIRQVVGIDIELTTDISKPAASDNINDALDYRAIGDRITDFVRGSSFFLVEALVEKIAAIVLDEFGIDRVLVKLSKPSAIENADNVSVQIERHR